MKISIRHRYIAKIPALEVTTEEQKKRSITFNCLLSWLAIS